ncbi:hypothetical protein ACBY01_16140 [Sphingomonas sp. ac-8]|uniref:hypothetical protein n=1 Tax=Sphingomonas sp. ac-8 TaxID=3242977 RepID=UPI003A7FDE3C
MLNWTGVLLPVPLSLLLAWLRPAWAPGRIASIAAAVAPIQIIANAVWLFVASVTTPQSECGTDACGMMIAVAMMLGVAAGGLFLLGWVLARATLWLVRVVR